MIKVYLACPFTSPEARIRHWRFLASAAACFELAKKGYSVYSPLVATYPMSLCDPENAELDYEFWMVFEDEWLQQCDEFHILKVPGWQESKGVARERERFLQLKPDGIIVDMEPVKMPMILQNWQMPLSDLFG